MDLSVAIGHKTWAGSPRALPTLLISLPPPRWGTVESSGSDLPGAGGYRIPGSEPGRWQLKGKPWWWPNRNFRTGGMLFLRADNRPGSQRKGARWSSKNAGKSDRRTGRVGVDETKVATALCQDSLSGGNGTKFRRRRQKNPHASQVKGQDARSGGGCEHHPPPLRNRRQNSSPRPLSSLPPPPPPPPPLGSVSVQLAVERPRVLALTRVPSRARPSGPCMLTPEPCRGAAAQVRPRKRSRKDPAPAKLAPVSSPTSPSSIAPPPPSTQPKTRAHSRPSQHPLSICYLDPLSAPSPSSLPSICADG